MKLDLDIPDRLGARALDSALEGLVGLAVEELQLGLPPELAGPNRDQWFPSLYDAGVRYQREVGTERWLTPSQTFAAGRGDCEDLASWRAAELRVSGEDPEARARVLRSGPRTWHAVVERGDGTLEDPSRELGMGVATVGALSDWQIRCEPVRGGGWACRLTRNGQGVMGAAPYGHDALADACELGAAVGSVIPGLDIIAQIARGALDVVAPTAASKAATTAPRPAQTTAARPVVVTPQLALPRPASSALALPQDFDGGSSADIERVARQISRMVHQESSRKLRDAARPQRRW